MVSLTFGFFWAQSIDMSLKKKSFRHFLAHWRAKNPDFASHLVLLTNHLVLLTLRMVLLTFRMVPLTQSELSY